jgi:hypothetical protein
LGKTVALGAPKVKMALRPCPLQVVDGYDVVWYRLARSIAKRYERVWETEWRAKRRLKSLARERGNRFLLLAEDIVVLQGLIMRRVEVAVDRWLARCGFS